MLEALGNHAKSERLHSGDGFVPILAIGHDARQGGYFREPTPIDFALNLNRERHPRNVPFGPAA